MAFKVGSGGVTVVSHDGKLNNDNQWPGDPVKMGHVDSDVTLNFDSDETTNYRMTYFPRTHSLPDIFTLRFAQGIWDSDRDGDFVPNRFFPFVPNIISIDAPLGVTTSEVSNPVKRSEFIKNEIYGNLTATINLGDAERPEEHFYPHGLKAITTSQDDYVVVAGRFSSNASGTINPTDYMPDAGVSLDSSFVQVFDKDGALVDTINDPSNSPGSSKTRKKYLARHVETVYVWRDYGEYGRWPWSQPPIDNYNNLLFLGNPNYLDSAGVNNILEGKVFVYDLNTKQFVDSIGPKKITDDQERFGDYLSVDSNRMAISSDEAIYLYKLDSSDPYKPYHIIEDSAQDGYNDRFDDRYYRNHHMNVKLYQNYVAVGRPKWSHRSSSSTPIRKNIGQFFIFDSAGKELYNYFDSDIPANDDDKDGTFLGTSICWAPYDSSRSRHGAIYVGAPSDYYAWKGNYSGIKGTSGLVYKFNFNLNTNTFSFGGKIRPTGAFSSKANMFGADIAADPNRDLLLIGAPFDSSNIEYNIYADLPMGAIYAYNYNSGSLTNQAQILDKTSLEEYISGTGRLGKEVDNDINNFFGGSIDLHRRPKNNRTFTTNNMTLKRPIGLANNVGQSGSILIQKRIDGDFGCDSEGFVTFDSCWWFPGGAEVDSAKRMNSLTPLLGSSFVTKDMLNYYVFDSDKIFCSWQKDLR